MSLLDAYRQKLEAQINEQKAKLDLLKARASKAAAHGKILGYEELAHADQHLGQVKAKFKELANAGGHALAEIRTGMGKALDDLKTSTQKAAVHLKSHAPAPVPKSAPRPKKPARAKARKPVVPLHRARPAQPVRRSKTKRK